MSLQPESFGPCRCLVTGGAGFIGSHLVERRLADGCHVTVIDDESTGTPANLAPVIGHRRLRYVRGDVNDGRQMSQLIAESEEVYHLAAAVGVQQIADTPIQSIEKNIAPVESLLREAARKHHAGEHIKVFLASSSEVYGKNPKPVWSEEDDLVFGTTSCSRWSYGASKAIDEFLALAYWRQDRLPVVIGRFFNVVGPRQTGRYGMVLPRLVQRALAGLPPIVHDDGQQLRCFAHVVDVCDAVARLMATPRAVGRVFNIGSDQPISILELAREVIAQVDPQLQVEFQTYRQAYSADFEDVRRRVPDLARLRETITYQPRYDLPQIISQVIAAAR